MKVLLLYPGFPDTFWSFKHVLKFIRKRAALPPLGLLTVTALLPEAWEKRLVDVNVGPLREKDLAWADVVMISAMIAQRESTVDLIARCRAAGRTIIAGGPLFTVEHARFPEVDHFVLNEAEVTLPEFLDDFARGEARRIYASAKLPGLQETPMPRWELADLQRYERQNRCRDLIADVKRIQRAGLQVQGGFILGFDHDPPNIFQRQIDFIQQSGIVTAMVGLLQAVPGTKLHERLHQQGRLLGATTGDNVDGTTNFVSRMNRDTLREGYRSVLDHLCAPGPCYRRIRTFLREFRPAPLASGVKGRNFLAFLRASVGLGVLGRERFHFWGVLVWTCFRRPRLVPTAVTLSIYGFHFRKCCAALGA